MHDKFLPIEGNRIEISCSRLFKASSSNPVSGFTHGNQVGLLALFSFPTKTMTTNLYMETLLNCSIPVNQLRF